MAIGKCATSGHLKMYRSPVLSLLGSSVIFGEMMMEHTFGGDWTTRKLEAIRQYLTAYATIMSKRRFAFAYVDAFAGTGYATRKKKALAGDALEGLAIDETRGVIEGSARLALQIGPPFDRYILIEKRATRCRELEGLRNEFPDRADSIIIQQGDANTILQDLCEKNWTKHRAVVFLDPYGMQADWATVEALAGTRAVDLWYLFPLGMGVIRMLTQSDTAMPESWSLTLDRVFGTRDWRGAFYETSRQLSLLGEEAVTVKTADFSAVKRFVVERLQTLFVAVAEQPLVLANSRGYPMYLLCFAASNEKGAPTALKIADHILKGLA